MVIATLCADFCRSPFGAPSGAKMPREARPCCGLCRHNSGAIHRCAPGQSCFLAAGYTGSVAATFIHLHRRHQAGRLPQALRINDTTWATSSLLRVCANGVMPALPRWPQQRKWAPLIRCPFLIVSGSPTWTRTRDLRINSPSLYRLSYQGIERCVLLTTNASNHSSRAF